MGLHAVPAMKDPMNSLLLLVEIVYDGLCVVGCGSSVDVDCVEISHFL